MCIYIYICVCIYIIFISTTGLCANIHLKRERRAGEGEDKSFPIKVVAKSDFTNYFDHCSASCKFANLRSSVPSTVIWARGKVHRLSRDLTKSYSQVFTNQERKEKKKEAQQRCTMRTILEDFQHSGSVLRGGGESHQTNSFRGKYQGGVNRFRVSILSPLNMIPTSLGWVFSESKRMKAIMHTRRRCQIHI